MHLLRTQTMDEHARSTEILSICGIQVTLEVGARAVCIDDVTHTAALRANQHRSKLDLQLRTLHQFLHHCCILTASILSYIMPFLRSSSLLRAAARPAAVRPALFSWPQVRYSTQDYGSGDGNPAGEKPQQQGKSRSEHLEHPGPAPPKVARGQSSSSPNEDSSSSSKDSSSSKGSSSPSSVSKPSDQSQSNDGAAKTGGGDGKSVNGARPKILNANPPATESEEVKQHNKEMEQRAEKAYEQVSNEDAEKDKVPKSFWSGKFCCASLMINWLKISQDKADETATRKEESCTK